MARKKKKQRPVYKRNYRRKKNKRGDFESILFVVLFLFIIGVIFFFTTHFKDEIYSNFQEELNTSEYNDTEAWNVLGEFRTSEISAWDYAFLAVFIGSMIALGLTAYAIRISPVFFWIYALMSLTILISGVIASNIWQDIASDPEFATTLTYFPITNSILGSYYPLIVVIIIITGMAVLFGKPPSQEGFV